MAAHYSGGKKGYSMSISELFEGGNGDDDPWNVFFGPRSLARCRGKLQKGEICSQMVDPCHLLRTATASDTDEKEGDDVDGCPYACKFRGIFRNGKDGVAKVVLDVEKSIDPRSSYAKITNNVVTGRLRMEGEKLYVDQRRVPLYLPYTLRNEKFAAVIMPTGGATVLFFANCKVVITGKVTVEGALFGLHMCRIELGRIPQPVLLKIVGEDGVTRKQLRLSYLKTILGFSRFAVQNVVGSGVLVGPGNSVDLALLHKSFPETSWDPEIFPGLKFHLRKGNRVLPGGFKCTAHIFETKIVIMAPKTAGEVKIAYDHFVRLVQPFVSPSSREYRANRYRYRYENMMTMHVRVPLAVPTLPPPLPSPTSTDGLRPPMVVVPETTHTNEKTQTPNSAARQLEEDMAARISAKDALIRDHWDLFENALPAGPHHQTGGGGVIRGRSTKTQREERETKTDVSRKRKRSSSPDVAATAAATVLPPSSSQSDDRKQRDSISILDFNFLSHLSEENMQSVRASLTLAKKMRHLHDTSAHGNGQNNNNGGSARDNGVATIAHKTKDNNNNSDISGLAPR